MTKRPRRALVTKELAKFLGALSHSNRTRAIEELRDGVHGGNSLQEARGISHCGDSRHLMVLRAHRLVSRRPEGRRVFYHLRQPEIAKWLLDAPEFLGRGSADAAQLRKAIGKSRKDWAGSRMNFLSH